MAHRPLENRVYRYRNPAMNFFCPLCGTERQFLGSPRLSAFNYMQLILISGIIIALAFPVTGFRSFPVFFILWAVFELVVRVRFKQEIPCPHCGFDATWYHRDVRVARKIVEDFWRNKKSAVPEPKNS